MKEEVRRIIKLVEDGKLSAEDAADLIDAISGRDKAESAETSAEAAEPSQTAAAPKDPIKQFVDAVEKATKEATEAVNWKEVAGQVRTGANKGLDALKSGIEQISKGKIDISFGLFGGTESKELTLPLSIGPGKTLRIENTAGDVKIVGGIEPSQVTAIAVFRGGSPEELRARADGYSLVIEESDHQVLLRQPDAAGLTVDLELHLPAGVPVEVRGESGDVTVTDTKAGARIHSRSGDVSLRNVGGVVEVEATSGHLTIEDSDTSSISVENKSGDIDLRRTRGNLNARTASGDVHVKQASGKTVALESVSGDVWLDLEQPVTGALSVRTVNGNALVQVPDGNDARVSLSTLRGVVRSGVRLYGEAKSDQRITGQLGGGTGTLDVSAVNGNVTLEMRDATAAS